MSLKLQHPWWAHLPAAACIVAMVIAAVFLFAHAPMRVPVHFGWDGQPGRWGSIVELAMMTIVFAVMGISTLAGSIVLDEIIARNEERRRYNWAALLDEGMIGLLLGIVVRMATHLDGPQPGRTIMGWGLGFSAMAVAAAAVLEWLRPPHAYRSLENTPPVVPTLQLPSQELQTLRSDRRWLYWEAQSPLLVRVVVLACGALVAVGAVASFPCLPWMLPLHVAIIAVLVLTYGGIRVSVTSAELAVRLGVSSLPLLRLPLGTIKSVEVMSFSPLADFGGWGIRYSLSKRMWGYFFAGTRGVKLETVKGKRYLIGSNDPEHLAAVCEAARVARNQQSAE